MTTFPALLDGFVRGQPGRPLVTYYDHASGERTELSVTTYANWVAKTAGLLVEECDLTRGDRLLVDLPTHWLGPVFLGAAWSAGLTVVWAGAAEAVVCGPGSLAGWTPLAGAVPVIATALLPLGGRFAEGVPAEVRDFGADVWSQPDSFVAWDPPQDADEATPGLTQAALWAESATGDLVGAEGRLLTAVNPATSDGLPVFTEPFARGGSVVLLAHSSADQRDATYVAERATARCP